MCWGNLIGECADGISAGHLDYLVSRRRLSEDTLREFRVGSFNLRRVLASCDREALCSAGVLWRKGPRYYTSPFEKRIVFPASDHYGEYIGLIGRSLVHGCRSKYYNTPYPKAENLFNLHRAKESILRSGIAIVVEGNLDVMSLHECGVRNAVGIGSAAFSDGHMYALLRYASRVLVATDNDEAGYMAADRIASKLQPLVDGGYVRVQRVCLPAKVKDFNDYLCEYGIEATRRFVSAYERVFEESAPPETFELSWSEEAQCPSTSPAGHISINSEKLA